MNNKIKILFTATFSTPFIQSDISIFKKHFTISVIIRSGITALFRYLFDITQHTVTYSWFASVYSSILVLFGKIFNKKSIIVLGGVDVARIPELKYGIWNSWWRSIIVGYGIRNADRILAVDVSLKNDAKRLAKYDGNNIVVIPTGYDPQVWIPGPAKENFVLTIANCKDRGRAMIKGLDFFSSVAEALPGVRFHLIGIHASLAGEFRFPSNVDVHDFLPPSRLKEFYQKAKVYLQPSRREGLPSTICEAMLCECYPIGTDVGGIPTAIGNTGSIIPFNDINAAVVEIQTAMKTERSTPARDRIIEHFSIEKREKALEAIIHSLTNE